MWKEQEVPATVIGVDKSAGVRKADGTLNDSWCRVGYLWTLNLRPTEQARTQRLPNSESREENHLHAALLLCDAITKDLITRLNSVMNRFFWFILLNAFYSFSSSASILSPPAPSSSPFLNFFQSGRAHGALVEALVDGDGHYSAWNGGLCLSCLPPLSHHHLLQGHQEVGCHFSVLFLFSA